ncbi:MAG: hypothetical protein QF609_03900, partial [Gammaproteobacteria bacterium]|nr:hypothetical protein [Gammaproteobacteria bacterium]
SSRCHGHILRPPFICRRRFLERNRAALQRRWIQRQSAAWLARTNEEHSLREGELDVDRAVALRRSHRSVTGTSTV